LNKHTKIEIHILFCDKFYLVTNIQTVQILSCDQHSNSTDFIL